MLTHPVTRFVRAETRRLLLAPASLGAAVLFAAYASFSIITWSGGCGSPEQAAAAGGFMCTSQDTLGFLLPLVATVIGGTAAAAERGRGGDVLWATRGIDARGYATGRIAAGALAAAVLVLVASVFAIATGVVAHPWRSPDLVGLGSSGFKPGVLPHPGTPFPALWSDVPLLGDLLAAVLASSGAAAFAAIGTAIGMYTRTPIVPVAVVVLGALMANWFVPHPLRLVLSPDNLFDFSPSSRMARDVVPAWRPVVQIAPAFVVLGLAWAAAVVGAKRERAR